MISASIKNALLGIVLAVVAAYLYPVVFFVFLEGPSGVLILFSLIPVYGLLYTYWIVIPLGVGRGMLIPQIACGRNRWMEALKGAGLGAVAGLVSAFTFISVFGHWAESVVLWVSVTAYCSLWVGGYAYYRSKNSCLYR